MKILPVSIYEEIDYYDNIVCSQTLNNVNTDDSSVEFATCSLNHCPEDAIIGRDIFTCYDYINALNYGIELAKNGYDEVQLVSVSSGRERL